MIYILKIKKDFIEIKVKTSSRFDAGLKGATSRMKASNNNNNNNNKAPEIMSKRDKNTISE